MLNVVILKWRPFEYKAKFEKKDKISPKYNINVNIFNIYKYENIF